MPSRPTRPPVSLMICLLAACLLLPARPSAEEIPLLEIQQRGWLGAAVAEYLEAFNAGDAEGLGAFFAMHRDAVSLARTPVELRVQRQLQFAGMLGTVEPWQILESEEGELRLVVRSTALDGWFELFFVESEVQAEKIGSMGLQPTTAPRDGSSEDEPVFTTLEELVESLRVSNGIPALAVAVAEGTGEQRVVVRGVRDIQSGVPAEENDRFHFGSITKSMTASVLARLVEQGVLDFEGALGELLPEVEMHEALREVTLRQLLRHRAGLEALLDPNAERERRWREAGESPVAQRLALARDVLSREPVINPGSGMLYSNAGYAVAAVVAEQRSGRSWEILVREELFAPLGLESAGIGWPATVQRPDQPRGHWPETSGPRPQELVGYEVGAPLAPAGDVHGSIGDLARYGWAHLRGLRGEDGWLRSESVRLLHAAPGEEPGGYAMGWMLEGEEGAILHVHPGGAGTFYAFLLLDPGNGRVVAVAMNDGDLGNDAIARRIVTEIARLRGE